MFKALSHLFDWIWVGGKKFEKSFKTHSHSLKKYLKFVIIFGVKDSIIIWFDSSNFQVHLIMEPAGSMI